MIGRFLERLRNTFIQSNRIHLRQNPAPTTRDLVDLIDRFVDGRMRYELEWDDFISWENENPHVEEIRNRIGQFERLLFSKDKRDRVLYAQKVIEERNRLAGLLGMAERGGQP